MVATQAEKDALKVMRKGTRACRECRRRKIKCIYHEHAKDDVCQECREHSRECIKQGVVRGSEKSSRGVKVQVARLESAVQRIVREHEQGRASAQPASDAPNPLIDSADFDALQKPLSTQSPLFTLFNNDLFRRQDTNEPDSVELSSSIAFADPTLTDKAKLLSTISAIPTINDVLKSAGEWWIAWRDQHFALRKAAARMTLASYVQSKIADDDPVIVSTGLIAIAMALQHLRSTVDDTGYTLPSPTHQLMSNIMAAVDQVVLDTPNYTNNREIVLLFMLRAKFHVENNQLRKAWMRIRQSIQSIQLMNLGAPSSEGAEITEEEAESQRFVGGIFEVDRLMSMVLGFPYATNESFTDLRAYSLLFSAGVDVQQKMRALRRIVAVTAGQVNDRNAIDDLSAETASRIQSSLEMASVCMPDGWWDLVKQPIIGSAHARHEHMMTQLWYWTVQTYAHMPFLIGRRAAAGSEYSKQLCMNGARNLITAFNYLRTEPAVSVYMCNCDDFQGLLGAVIMLVGLIQDAAQATESGQDPYTCMAACSQLEADIALIDEMREIFRYRQYQQGGSMSKQGLTVLDGLMSFLFEDDSDTEEFDFSPRRQKTIMLPYFGTITVELTKKLSRLGSVHHRQSSQSVPTKLPTPPPSTDGYSQGSAQVTDDGWLSAEPLQSDSSLTPSLGLEGWYSESSGIPTIDWSHWDHFMQNSELSQDWNPDWNLTDYFTQEGVAG